jgi:hypothetical protein
VRLSLQRHPPHSTNLQLTYLRLIYLQVALLVGVTSGATLAIPLNSIVAQYLHN